MAITVRKGYENQFDINKMLPGEFAVTTDTHKVYVCMAAGISKELASVEELQSILGASDEAFQAFQELINAMESDTVITGLLTDVNNLKSGEYTISFAEAEERTNIEVTDTVKTILGKIKKFFTDLSTVAFSGKYEDLTGTPTLANVATSGSYADLKNLPTLGDAASKAVANNDTTTEAGYVADARAVNALGKEVDELNTNMVIIQSGSVSVPDIISGSSTVVSVTFPKQFTEKPIVSIDASASGYQISLSLKKVSTTAFEAWVKNESTGTMTNRTVSWNAIGKP